jgi:cGMP-dependent protein kinase
VIAVTPVECLVLERSAFQSLIGDGINDALDLASWRHNRGNDEELAKASEEVDYANAASTDFAFQDLKVMRTVGVGTFGRVKLVQHLPSGMVAALKCVSKTTLLKTKQVQNIMNERNFLYACGKCPFVMGLYQTFNLPNEVFMLSELVQGGELWSYIYERTSGTIPRNSVGGFAMPAVKFYAANILLAFQYLHQKGIMYRDLKPENLLIGQDGYLKLIDFGFAKKLPCSKNGVLQTKTYTLCGTPEYLAPEVVLSKGYDWAVDCWSFGCILYELYLGRTPFAAEFTTKIFQNIVSCEKTLKFHPGMDPQHVELIKRLLIPNPALRMGNLNGGLKDVMEHNFFSSVDFEKLNSMSTNPPYIPAVIDNLDVSNYDTYDEVQVEPYTGDQNAFALF